jgi:hypothetical protein
VNQYVAAFGQVAAGAHDQARGALKNLAATVSTRVASDRQDALRTLIEGQLAKLA